MKIMADFCIRIGDNIHPVFFRDNKFYFDSKFSNKSFTASQLDGFVKNSSGKAVFVYADNYLANLTDFPAEKMQDLVSTDGANGSLAQTMISDLICTVGEQNIFLKKFDNDVWHRLDVVDGTWKSISNDQIRSINSHIANGSFNDVYSREKLDNATHNQTISNMQVNVDGGLNINNNDLKIDIVSLDDLLKSINDDFDLNSAALNNASITEEEVRVAFRDLEPSLTGAGGSVDEESLNGVATEVVNAVKKHAELAGVPEIAKDLDDKFKEIVADDDLDTNKKIDMMKSAAFEAAEDVDALNDMPSEDLSDDTLQVSEPSTYNSFDTDDPDINSSNKDVNHVTAPIIDNGMRDLQTDLHLRDTERLRGDVINQGRDIADHSAKIHGLEHDRDLHLRDTERLRSDVINQGRDIADHSAGIHGLEHDRDLHWRDTERLRSDVASYGQDISSLRNESLLHGGRIDNLGRESLESRIDIGNLRSNVDRSHATVQDHSGRISDLTVGTAMHGEHLNTHSHDITRTYGKLDSHSQRINDVMFGMHNTSQDIKLMDTVARMEKERIQDRMNAMQQEHARDISRIQKELERSQQMPYAPMQGAFAMQHGMGDLAGRMQQVELLLAKMQQADARNANLQQSLDRIDKLANAVEANKNAIEGIKLDNESFGDKRDADVNSELKSLSDRSNALSREIANIKAASNDLSEMTPSVQLNASDIANQLANSESFQSAVAAKVPQPQTVLVPNMQSAVDNTKHDVQVAKVSPNIGLANPAIVAPVKPYTPTASQVYAPSFVPSPMKQEQGVDSAYNNILAGLKDDLILKKGVFISKVHKDIGIGISHDTSKYDSATDDDFSVRLRRDSNNKSRLDIVMHSPGCMVDPDVLYGVVRGQVDLVNIADDGGKSIAHFAPGDNNYELHSAPLVIENFAPRSAPEHERKMIRVIVHEDGRLEVSHRDDGYNDAELDNIKISGRSIKSILDTKVRVNIYDDVDERVFDVGEEGSDIVSSTVEQDSAFSQGHNAPSYQSHSTNRMEGLHSAVDREFEADAFKSEVDRHAIRGMESKHLSDDAYRKPSARRMKDEKSKVSYSRKDDTLVLSVPDKVLAIKEGALNLGNIRERMNANGLSKTVVLMPGDLPSFNITVEKDDEDVDKVVINTINESNKASKVDLDASFINVGDNLVSFNGQGTDAMPEDVLLEESCLNVDHSCSVKLNGEEIDIEDVDRMLDDASYRFGQILEEVDKDIEDSALEREKLSMIEKDASKSSYRRGRSDRGLARDLESHAASRDRLDALEAENRSTGVHKLGKVKLTNKPEKMFVIAHDIDFDNANDYVDGLEVSSLLQSMHDAGVSSARIRGSYVDFDIHSSSDGEVRIDNIQQSDKDRDGNGLHIIVNNRALNVDGNGVKGFIDLGMHNLDLHLDVPVKLVIDGNLVVQKAINNKVNLFGEKPNDHTMKELSSIEWISYKDDTRKEHYVDTSLQKSKGKSWRTEDRFLEAKDTLPKGSNVFIKDTKRNGKSYVRFNKDKTAISVKSEGYKEERALNLAEFATGKLSSVSSIDWTREIKSSENKKNVLLGSNISIAVQREDDMVNFDISNFSSRHSQHVLLGNKVIAVDPNGSGARVVIDGFASHDERRLWEQSCNIIAPFPSDGLQEVSVSFNGSRVAVVNNADRNKDAYSMKNDNKNAVGKYVNKYSKDKEHISNVRAQLGFDGGEKDSFSLFQSKGNGFVAVVRDNKTGFTPKPELFHERKSSPFFNKSAKKMTDSMQELRVCNEANGKCFKLGFGTDSTNGSSILRVDENIGGLVYLRTDTNLIAINGNSIVTSRLPPWLSREKDAKYSNFDIDLREIKPKEGLRIEFAGAGHYAFVTRSGDVSINKKYAHDKSSTVQKDNADKDINNTKKSDKSQTMKKNTENSKSTKKESMDSVADIYDGESKLSSTDLDKLKSQVSKFKDKELLERTGSLLSGDTKYLEQEEESQDAKLSKAEKAKLDKYSSGEKSSPLR